MTIPPVLIVPIGVLMVAGFLLTLALLTKRRVDHHRYVNGDMTGGMNMSGSFTINQSGFTGKNVIIANGRVIIDGKDVTAEVGPPIQGIMEIRITGGSIGSLDTTASVFCEAVQGDVDAGGSVSCGDVGGDVDAGGSVKCGKVAGDVDAGGSVRVG